jgi:hypothetical protein
MTTKVQKIETLICDFCERELDPGEQFYKRCLGEGKEDYEVRRFPASSEYMTMDVCVGCQDALRNLISTRRKLESIQIKPCQR